MMDKETIRRRRDEIIREDGPWTSHNIRLADDIYTIQPGIVGWEVKIWRLLRLAADIGRKPIHELRVLDLACMEGMLALEFAMHGARTVGIEARGVHVRKAEFAREALGLDNAEFHQDDVRNLAAGKYGRFDVVFCMGILYHLDARDVFDLIERIGEVTLSMAVFDTHIDLEGLETREHKGRTYWGRGYTEHEPDLSDEAKQQNLWASLDNEKSFWPTRASLINAIGDAGFTSVHQAFFPATYEPDHRVTLFAMKGEPADLKTAVPGYANQPRRYPEDRQLEAQNKPLGPINRDGTQGKPGWLGKLFGK
jgi:hypothetical protein